MVKELGVRIREARESRGLSVDDLHARTKIRHRIIEAIEDGRFDAIPGGAVYFKGFIRTIAEELNLDYNELLQLWEPTAPPPPPKKKTSAAPSVYPIVGAVLMVLALIGAGVYYIYFRPQPQLPPTVPPQVINPPVEEPEPQPEEPTVPEEPAPPAFVFVGEENNRLVYTVASWPMELAVRVTRDACWVLAQPDNSRIEVTLYANQEQSFTANNTMELRLGKAQVAEILVNGESLGGQTGDVRDYTFRKSGP